MTIRIYVAPSFISGSKEARADVLLVDGEMIRRPLSVEHLNKTTTPSSLNYEALCRMFSSVGINVRNSFKIDIDFEGMTIFSYSEPKTLTLDGELAQERIYIPFEN